MVRRIHHDGTRRAAAVPARRTAQLYPARVGPGPIDGPEDPALQAQPAAGRQLDRKTASPSQRTLPPRRRPPTGHTGPPFGRRGKIVTAAGPTRAGGSRARPARTGSRPVSPSLPVIGRPTVRWAWAWPDRPE